MRKEVLYAIIAGVILGLIVAFGVWRINSSVATNNTSGVDKPTPMPTPDGPREFKVVLDKPENNDVVTTNSVTVSGLTKPLSWITLSGETGDYIIQADSVGAFAQAVDLTGGINQIKVTAFDLTGNQNATSVLVVYSSSFQERTIPSGSPSAASDSSDIRQKVALDVANTLSRPKAYIGTVTDITDSTLEIKTNTSNIEQISVGATTTSVLNTVGTNNKQVKTTDIAIGDFTIAMGYVGTNSVLSAQRILITDPISEPKITISEAKVVSVTKKALTVTGLADGKQDTIQPDGKTDIETVAAGVSKSAKFGTISAGDMVIYVVSTDDKSVTSVRSVFVIS